MKNNKKKIFVITMSLKVRYIETEDKTVEL